MADTTGLFVLGVRVENVASEIKKLERLGAAADQLATKFKNIGSVGNSNIFRDLSRSFTDVNRISKSLQQVNVQQAKSVRDLAAAYKQVADQVSTVGRRLDRAFDRGINQKKKLNREVGVFDGLMNSAIGKIIRYRLAFAAWQESINLMGNLVRTTIDFEQSLIGLQKVMDETTTDFAFLTDTAFQLGRRFGASALDVAQSMRVWAQQGNNANQIASLTEASLTAMGASGLTATEAVEALTAATRAFNIPAENSIELVDRWQAVQARFAVTAQDLANATKAVGSAAQASGLTLDELNGVVAAIGSTTRKTGREVANSFKTILARLNRNTTIREFQRLGIAVKASADEMRPVSAVLADLAEQWPTLTNAQKNNIAITASGIRRYTDFVVLMDQFDDFVGATAVSFNALGESTIDAQLQAQSYENQIQSMLTAFQELGITIGESGLLEVITNFASTLSSTADVIKPFSGEIVALLKLLTGIGVPLLAGVAAFKGLSAILGVATAVLGKFRGAVLIGGRSMTIFRSQALAMSAGLKGVQVAATGAVAALGSIAGLAVGIATLVVVLDDLFGSASAGADSLRELADNVQLQVQRSKEATDSYRRNAAFINELRSAIEKAKDEYSDISDEQERNDKVTQKILKTYGKQIRQIPALAGALADGVGTFDLSVENLDRTLNQFEENAQRSLNNTRTLAEENNRQLNTILSDLINLSNQTQGLRDQLEGENLGDLRLVSSRAIGRDGTRIVNELSDQGEDIRDALLDAIEPTTLNEQFRDKIEKAFEDVGRGVINKDQFAREFTELLQVINAAAQTVGSRTEEEITKNVGLINDSTAALLNAADSLFFVEDTATKLIAALAGLSAETVNFEQNSNRLASLVGSTGLEFNKATDAVKFYRNQLNKSFELERAQELKIALQEQRIEFAKLENVSQETIAQEEKKLDVLVRERDAVNSLIKGHLAEKKAIVETTNETNKRLFKTAAANQTNKELVRDTNLAIKENNRATTETLKQLDEQFRKTVGLAGQYGKIRAAAEAYRDKLAEAVKEQIELTRSADAAAQPLRDQLASIQQQIRFVNARNNSEQQVLGLRRRSLDLQIRDLESKQKLNDGTFDNIKLEEQILKLKEKQRDIDRQSAGTDELQRILGLQTGLNLEVAKQEAVTQILVAQQKTFSDQVEDVLFLEKERAKTVNDLLELKQREANINQSDEAAIKRREALALRLIGIERRILEARLDNIRQFREGLRDISSDLQGLVGDNLGTVVQRQAEAAAELRDIEQDILEVERDRVIALQEGNEEGLFRANKELADLIERQNELNSATFVWKETLKSTLSDVSNLINENLAQQFADNLVNLGGDESLGIRFAESITLGPDPEKFGLTAEEISNRLQQSITDAGLTMGNNLATSITDSGNNASVAIGSSLNTAGDAVAAKIAAAISASGAAADGATGVVEGLLGGDEEQQGGAAGATGLAATIINSFAAGAQISGEAMLFAFTQGGSIAAQQIAAALAAGAVSTGDAATEGADKTAGALIAGAAQLATAIQSSGEKAGQSQQQSIDTSTNRFSASVTQTFNSAARLLGNVIGQQLGGGGQFAGIGSSIGGTLGGATPLGPFGAILGSVAGGLIGGLFDDDGDAESDPIFDQINKSNPLPVRVEGFGERETILHDVSVVVEANFLDPSQLNPVAMRELAQHVREETEELLRRENIWNG